jgi:hypothetical protein
MTVSCSATDQRAQVEVRIPLVNNLNGEEGK